MCVLCVLCLLCVLCVLCVLGGLEGGEDVRVVWGLLSLSLREGRDCALE